MSAQPVEFAPEPGDVGSWVTLPDGTRGQVWSRGVCEQRWVVADRVMDEPEKRRREPWCWVATGTEFVAIPLAALLAAQRIDDVPMFEELLP